MLARHWRQHVRFYGAAAIAILSIFVFRLFDPEIAFIAAGDVFFITFFLSMLQKAAKADVTTLRARAKVEDEGIVLIVGLTIAAIIFSFGSMFSILNSGDGRPLSHLLTALASIPLGWLVLNSLFAFHYARLYYAPAGTDGKATDAAGLDFPESPEPVIWDFFYFSFVIGATFQTSDVGIKNTDFRVVVLFHSIASFVFNTVLLALAVNVGASLVH
ncbi:DUF1345 domain-containing protein [Kaistia dalseonensis]|uniref:Membrane protein n=1 Tax=Kaistia dalseonensis TaxID=410840 RepID=A0ABU0H856_9HYPH|nr:DUF1345 domain-containing protein [Kaistia dalseonensis]MCX5495887.1 DUF1345 domain-containing protein [Kaistia dalseonensis]MDQ0438489.1 putative membrane protein [Kaistia dalseonensis]